MKKMLILLIILMAASTWAQFSSPVKLTAVDTDGDGDIDAYVTTLKQGANITFGVVGRVLTIAGAGVGGGTDTVFVSNDANSDSISNINNAIHMHWGNGIDVTLVNGVATVSVDASELSIAFADSSGATSTEGLQDKAGAMVSGNTESGISVTYDDPGGKLNFSVLIDSTNVVDAGISLPKLAREGASAGQVVKWDGSKWWPGTDAGGGSGGTEDTVKINDGAGEYSSINNQLKIKEGFKLNIVREDSTLYDVFIFNVIPDSSKLDTLDSWTIAELFDTLDVNYVLLVDFAKVADDTSAWNGYGDSIGVDTDGNGTTDAYIRPAVIKKGTNVTLAVNGDVLTISSTGGGSGDDVKADTNGYQAPNYVADMTTAVLQQGSRLDMRITNGDTLYIGVDSSGFYSISQMKDSLGTRVDVDGGAFDFVLKPPYLREGASINFSVTGDTLTISATGGAGSADTAWIVNDAGNDSINNLGDASHLHFGTGIDATISGKRISVVVDKGELSLAFSDLSGSATDAQVPNDITVNYADSSAKTTTEGIEDKVGAMVSGNSETNIAVTYDDVNGKLDFNVTGGSGDNVKADTGGAVIDPSTVILQAGPRMQIDADGDTIRFSPDSTSFYSLAALEDSLGLHVDVDGGGFDYLLDPSWLREGGNITFSVIGDTLTIAGGGAGAGTGDTLIFNDGSNEFSIIANLIKLKEGTGIDLVRDDSTNYDVIRIVNLLGTTIGASELEANSVTTYNIPADSINELDIDWGTASNQVSTDDVPEGSTNKYNPFGTAIENSEILDQTVVPADVDSTAQKFVFSDAYRGTSALGDSLLATLRYVQLIVGDSLDEYLLATQKAADVETTGTDISTALGKRTSDEEFAKVSDDTATWHSYGDSIAVDEDNDGVADRYIRPALLSEGTNITFSGTGDRLIITGAAGGSGDNVKVDTNGSSPGSVVDVSTAVIQAGPRMQVDVVNGDTVVVSPDSASFFSMPALKDTISIYFFGLIDFDGLWIDTTAAGKLTLKPNSIDSTRMAPASIDSSEIKNGAVTKPKIAADQITTYHIPPDSVNDLDIDFGTATNQVNTDDVPEGSTNKYNPFGAEISSSEIAPNTIAGADVGAGVITTYHIPNDSIQDPDIDFGTGTNQVSTDDIPEGSTNKYNPFGTSVDGSEVTDQSLTKSDADTTSSNFPFDGAFHITTAVPESAFASLKSAKKVFNDSIGVVDSSRIGDNKLSEADINWRRRLKALEMFHGKSSILEDSMYFSVPQHNLISFWLASDSAGNITVGDDDTLFASAFFETATTLDSLILFYKNKNASSSIVKYTLWGPDRSDGTNVGDSCYYGRLVDSLTARTATTWTRVAIDINDVVVNAGEVFGIKFIDDFQADYAVVLYGRGCAFVVKK